MMITVPVKLATANFMRKRLFSIARMSIMSHKITPGEQAISQTIYSQYGLNLVEAALYVLGTSKFYTNRTDAITIIPNTRKADKLASLITYGNGVVSGSNILVNAFKLR